jgi:DNA-binding NtrC family response regulator
MAGQRARAFKCDRKRIHLLTIASHWLDDLPGAAVASRPERSSRCSNGPTQEAERALPIGSFAEAEREIIARALKTTEGNKVQAAALLRISRKKLYAKIEKYGLFFFPVLTVERPMRTPLR